MQKLDWHDVQIIGCFLGVVTIPTICFGITLQKFYNDMEKNKERGKQ